MSLDSQTEEELHGNREVDPKIKKLYYKGKDGRSYDSLSGMDAGNESFTIGLAAQKDKEDKGPQLTRDQLDAQQRAELSGRGLLRPIITKSSVKPR